MTSKKLAGAAALILLGSLAACGGGSGSSDSGSAGGQQPSNASTVISAWIDALTSTSTASGTDNTALKNAFDDKFLDAGYSKTQVLENLSLDAQAMSSVEFSGFPQLQLSDVQIGDCADNICTLTGTLTNSDADTTSTPISVRVIQTGGVYRLYGDQTNS